MANNPVKILYFWNNDTELLKDLEKALKNKRF